MKSVVLRTQGDFSTEPQELARQTGELERNVADALRGTWFGAAGRLEPTYEKVSATTIRVGELASIYSAYANVVVTVPAAHAQNAGDWFGVIRSHVGNTITLAPPAGSTKVQGAASYDLPATVGLTLWMSDGTGWWGTV